MPVAFQSTSPPSVFIGNWMPAMTQSLVRQAKSAGDSLLAEDLQAALRLATIQHHLLFAFEQRRRHDVERSSALPLTIIPLRASLKDASDLYNTFASPFQVTF